jgi:Serine dehydrogenase proteinase
MTEPRNPPSPMPGVPNVPLPGSPAPVPANANDFIEQQLDSRLGALEKAFDADAIAFSGPLIFGVDDLLRPCIERIKKKHPVRNKLLFVVTTEGGYIEVVHRIVETMRKHYEIVDFIVPNSAYSAGTILVLSGDAIHMDYYSRLGPIDPQVESMQGRNVPALGYLEQYQRLIKKASRRRISPAEIQLLVYGFDQAELYQYEHQRELSVALLREWLANYKFKNWKITRTRKKRVTPAMRKRRASEIAKQLNDTKAWHSHGYGISKDVLEKKLNLIIDDFGANDGLCDKIRAYYDLSADYMMKRATRGVMHVVGDYRPFA